ncbi:MAG: hypothetical protein KF787_11230 [Phycisphaeraceae bacterium]|nr:hypothetical protein [Phycisphaerae bacterium]MBX3393208.1 hypothetical protein [Phycisphaeraceae bacterium]
MSTQSVTSEAPSFGRFRLVRPLSPASYAERWLSLHEDDHTSHVVYRFGAISDKAGQRRFLSATERAESLRDHHLLEIQYFSFDAVGRPCVVTPYLGNHDGLVSLRSLAEMKGGRLSPLETERAVVHVLEGLRAAHRSIGPSHGPVRMDGLLVDRHGRVWIELYGLRRAMRGMTDPVPELAQDEVRSVVEIAYELLTGLPAEEPRISAGRLVKKIDPAWDDWLDRGLSGFDGFQTADEALSVLPSAEPVIREPKPTGPVRSLFSRFRWPTRTG